MRVHPIGTYDLECKFRMFFDQIKIIKNSERARSVYNSD